MVPAMAAPPTCFPFILFLFFSDLGGSREEEELEYWVWKGASWPPTDAHGGDSDDMVFFGVCV